MDKPKYYYNPHTMRFCSQSWICAISLQGIINITLVWIPRSIAFHWLCKSWVDEVVRHSWGWLEFNSNKAISYSQFNNIALDLLLISLHVFLWTTQYYTMYVIYILTSGYMLKIYLSQLFFRFLHWYKQHQSTYSDIHSKSVFWLIRKFVAFKTVTDKEYVLS